MAESRYEHDQSGQPHPAGQLKRRGMLAGVAALVAAGLHRGTARPVAAGMDGDLTLGATNTLVSGTNNTQTTLKPAAADFPDPSC